LFGINPQLAQFLRQPRGAFRFGLRALFGLPPHSDFLIGAFRFPGRASGFLGGALLAGLFRTSLGTSLM
jgi:hypothetical protein